MQSIKSDNQDIPDCSHQYGHNWLRTYTKKDGKVTEVTKRRCSHCKYVDEDVYVDDSPPESLRCRVGWHSYVRTGRVNQANQRGLACKRCEKHIWV